MSTQRWTVCELSGPNLSPSILSLLSAVKLLIFFHTAASETKLLPTVVVAILGSETTECRDDEASHFDGCIDDVCRFGLCRPLFYGFHAAQRKDGDAGSGPTPGAAADAPQPTAQQPGANGSTASGDNPKQSGTKLMNDALAGKAASSQDVQKQIQGQPTAAEEAAGAKPDC